MSPTRLVRLLAGLVMVVGIMTAFPGPLPAAGPLLDDIIQDEAYWISLTQVPPGRGPASGAIARYRLDEHTTQAYISPYDGTVGARGMLLGGPRYQPMVRAWIDWYFANVNWPDYSGVYGTVHDYWANPQTGDQQLVIDPLTGEGRYDSTDAYAGVFLSLLRAYAEQVPDEHDYLRQRRYLIDVIANVVIATKHENGLTGARPDWGGEYLLDNIDAEQGLADYVWLAENVLDEPGVGAYWTGEAESLRAAVEYELWLSEVGMYKWASDQSNPSWDTFYADATSQSWPIIYRHADSSRGLGLWATFNAIWPQWVTSADNPGTPDQQPWAVLAVAAAVMGERQQTLDYLSGSEQTWVSTGRPWPWSVNDSTHRAMAAAAARDAGWAG